MEKVHVKIKRGIWFFVAALIFAVAIGCSRQTEFETQARSDEELLAMYGVVPLDPETYVKPIPAVPGSERDLAILELLFRLTMAWNDNISCWYLDYGEGSDAPPEFMERFKDIPLTIKTYSKVARDPLHGSVLKHEWEAGGNCGGTNCSMG